ncbi:hypothetical protein CYMTET_11838 [Cymbomonas tetramitiformis]|uniref:Uncharacterized protein n=2 Tax=Cymbomonas tetramitiformis TaxID=36881 RepID=A0AAE0GLS4_9CHLO|nr:hypothetical protein CYMTET_11838 [Cymbomonas tetramitiformis]
MELARSLTSSTGTFWTWSISLSTSIQAHLRNRLVVPGNELSSAHKLRKRLTEHRNIPLITRITGSAILVEQTAVHEGTTKRLGMLANLTDGKQGEMQGEQSSMAPGFVPDEQSVLAELTKDELLQGWWKLAELHIDEDVNVPKDWWPEVDLPSTFDGENIPCVVRQYEPHHFGPYQGAFLFSCDVSAFAKEYPVTEYDYAVLKAATPRKPKKYAEGPLSYPSIQSPTKSLDSKGKEETQARSKASCFGLWSSSLENVRGFNFNDAERPDSPASSVGGKANNSGKAARRELEALKKGVAAASEIDAETGKMLGSAASCQQLCSIWKGPKCCYDVVCTIPFLTILMILVSLLGAGMAVRGFNDAKDDIEELDVGLDTTYVSKYAFYIYLAFFGFHVFLLAVTLIANIPVRECCCVCLPKIFVVAWQGITAVIMIASYAIFWVLFFLWYGLSVVLLLWHLINAVCKSGEEAIASFDTHILPALKDETGAKINLPDDYCPNFESVDHMQWIVCGTFLVFLSHTILMLVSVANYYLALKEFSLNLLRLKLSWAYSNAFGKKSHLERAVQSIDDFAPPSKQMMRLDDSPHRSQEFL